MKSSTASLDVGQSPAAGEEQPQEGCVEGGVRPPPHWVLPYWAFPRESLKFQAKAAFQFEPQTFRKGHWTSREGQNKPFQEFFGIPGEKTLTHKEISAGFQGRTFTHIEIVQSFHEFVWIPGKRDSDRQCRLLEPISPRSCRDSREGTSPKLRSLDISRKSLKFQQTRINWIAAALAPDR